MKHRIDFWLAVTFSSTFVLAGSPPRIISNSIRHTAVLGEEALLKCPVEVEAQQSYYEWQKDNDIIHETSYYDQRFKLTRKGILKIKNITRKDEGDWLCRVTNGFGSVDAIVILEVAEEKDHMQINVQTGNHYPEDDTIVTRSSRLKWAKLSKHNMTVKPHGSSSHFTCKAVGNPRPNIKWQKNGQTLARDNSRIKVMHYSLRIDDLKETDSGNYTCTVYNIHGSLNNTYTLEVVGLLDEKPEILDHHPMNTTVLFNGTTALQCRVKSKVVPVIKWLKQLSKEEKSRMPEKQTVKVDNEYYKVLKSFQLIQQTDGSYLNKLVIKNANFTHAGKYTCWAANVLGYNVRSSYLNVIHGDQLMHGSQLYSGKGRPSHTETILIIVVSAVIILSIILVIILLYLHLRRTGNSRTMYSKAKS